jgi:serine/threonine protein kinase
MPLSAGDRLGPYEILAPIGSGGMGDVYRARDTRLGREVAIKLLRAGKLANRDRTARFIQEALAASALNHPHIITIHDIGNEAGSDFLVMEYVKGHPLDQLIPRHGMPVPEVLRLSVQVAEASGRGERFRRSAPLLRAIPFCLWTQEGRRIPR